MARRLRNLERRNNKPAPHHIMEVYLRYVTMNEMKFEAHSEIKSWEKPTVFSQWL